MKKPLAILLLILGGLVTISLIALVTGVAFMILSLFIPVGGEWAFYGVGAMFLFLVCYPFKFLRFNLRKKYNINEAMFIVYSCAPSLIAAEIANLLTEHKVPDAASGDISIEVLFFFWLIITAAITFWMIVQSGVEAYKRYMDKNA